MDKPAEQAGFQKAQDGCYCVHVCIIFSQLSMWSCESLFIRSFMAALTVPHENPVSDLVHGMQNKMRENENLDKNIFFHVRVLQMLERLYSDFMVYL